MIGVLLIATLGFLGTSLQCPYINFIKISGAQDLYGSNADGIYQFDEISER